MALPSNAEMSKQPSFAGSNASWLVYGLAILTVAAGIFVVATITRLSANAADERAWIRLAAGIQVDSQRLSKAAVETALGNLDAFDQLESAHRTVDINVRLLRSGDSDLGLPAAPPDVGAEMTGINVNWGTISVNAQTIIGSEALVNELAESGANFLANIGSLKSASDRVLVNLMESGAPNQQVFTAGRLITIVERMHRGVQELLASGGTADDAAQNLRDLMGFFENAEAALRNGNTRLGVPKVVNQQALASLAQVRRGFEDLKPLLETILESSVNLEDVRQAADAIFLDSDRLFAQAGDLVEAISGLPRSRVWPSTSATTIGLVLLIASLAALIGLVILSARRRADTAFRSNRRTQQSIVRLLDELSSLADGDLTARATVSDELTGAIADAVNFAVEQLRELVRDINRTASSVAESAEHTRRTTTDLVQSADEQAAQVTRATDRIKEMSQAFGAMAVSSKESSDTALASVDIAKQGGIKVRDTIEGMSTIREQIQQTSKRIKRLGESTQEIGNIVKLIDEIAEQTNVLALNAAIQAASAGGSGQGFAVVADEVQQLAESATKATKRISGLVQTIQVDTAEAMKSMEATTTEVVNGAQLAHDAGAALVQTERVSTELSDLVQGIANEAQTHSEAAARISELMDGIRDVSVKTSEGTAHTAKSVSELADHVLQLQASVSDFKLPPEDETETLPLDPDRVTETIDFEAIDAPEDWVPPSDKRAAEAPDETETDEPAAVAEKDAPDPDLPLGGAARKAAVEKRGEN
jgi:twitching motility protein PilJ